MVTEEWKEGDLIRRVGLDEALGRPARGIDLFEAGILGEMTKGHYVILPKGMRMLNAIYSQLQEYITFPLGFEEVVLPKMAPVPTFHKAALLPHWNPDVLTATPFAETEGVAEDYILDPLQCTVFYQYLEGKQIDVTDGPLRWFDRSGPTYRNENLDELMPGVRQREFHRAEFVFAGVEEQVIDTRERCLAQLEQLCQDLDLGYRIVVGAGCHRFEEHEKTYSHQKRDIQIKDIEIFCSGYGFLEVSGNSVLGSVLTSRFSIAGTKGEELWSGCSGVGLNRVMYAVITNHGTENTPLDRRTDYATR